MSGLLNHARVIGDRGDRFVSGKKKGGASTYYV